MGMIMTVCLLLACKGEGSWTCIEVSLPEGSEQHWDEGTGQPYVPHSFCVSILTHQSDAFTYSGN